MEVSELVAWSLRILGVIDPKQPVKDVDMQTGIQALNGMMNRWKANGVEVGYSTVSSPSDTLPVPPEAEEAVAFNLALTLRPQYRVSLEMDVIAIARNGYALLQRDNAIANPLGWNRTGWGYNTYTDTWGYGGTIR